LAQTLAASSTLCRRAVVVLSSVLICHDDTKQMLEN
jgi:hypothetical protein